MLFVNAETVERLLPMGNCIRIMREALVDYSYKKTTQAPRVAMRIERGKILGVMPCAIKAKHVAGAKIITVFPGNFKNGLPSHQGVVAVFETETGRLRAVVDGEAITGIRTAAVSAVATDALSRRNSRALCIMGSGLQARRHLEAIRLVRNITEVRVWDIDTASAVRYAEEMREIHNIPVVSYGDDAEKAAYGADIICTVTAAKQPILLKQHVAPGTHINAVGACAPADRELDSQLVAGALFYCDSTESVMLESGDYLIPLKEGRIAEGHMLGEIGRVLMGRLHGRENPEDVTIFESLGLAVEDLTAADYIVNLIESGEAGDTQD